MELFNKYKNKDFYYIVNLINKINIYDEKIKEKDVVNYFKETGSFEEIANYITGTEKDYKLFEITKDNYLKVKEEYNIPIRLTYSERAWLYNILHDSKAELFLDRKAIDELKKLLEDTVNMPYPLSNNDIHICKLNNREENKKWSEEEIENFRLIKKAVKEHRYIRLTNNADNGIIYKASRLFPYKIEYIYKKDTFSITCLDEENSDVIRVYFTNITDLTIEEETQDYDTLSQKIENILDLKKTKEPLIIEINDDKNALQRCSYIFSIYDRETYIENNKTYMKIYYYEEYQQEEIITSILQMGKFVKVVSPLKIKERIVNTIKEKSKNYK